VTTALYRRYRPESFAEVIGQEQVTGPLSIALTKNRVNHAYLFSGPRGCGKTTSARILARCLNCAEGPTPTPCGVCPSCVELARGGPGSLDVVEIDAASHGGVDDARDLRERAAFAPVRDRYKVFIIDEAHMVSPQGFNALLKIVEEPPEHIRFIFATTEPEKVIGTIRSRTHHYPFRLVPPERLVTYLAELCEREAVPVGKGVLPLVVRSGGGSVRDSLSVLDQLISGAGDEGLSYPTAVALLGYTDVALLDDVTDALAAGDGATVFRVVDRVIESGHDPRRFVEDLLERLRDLLVVAALRDGGHAVFRGLPDDQLERMRSQAGRFGSAELSRAADVTNAALTEMTGATSPRLQLELLCARLLLPSAEEGERGLAARLDRLEKRVNLTGGLAAPAPEPVRSPSGASASSGPSGAPSAGASGAPSAGLSGVAASAGARPGAAADRSRPSASRPEPASVDAPEAAGSALADDGARSAAAWPEPSGPSAPSGSSGVEAPASAPVPSRSPVASPPGAVPAAGPMDAPASVGAGAQASAGAGDLEAVRRMWTEVLGALATIKRTTWSLVSQYAQVLDHDGKRLLLGFDSPGRAQSFARGAHPEFLRQALIDVIGLDCPVEAIASTEFRAGGAGAAAAVPQDSRSGSAPRAVATGPRSPSAPPTSAPPASSSPPVSSSPPASPAPAASSTHAAPPPRSSPPGPRAQQSSAAPPDRNAGPGASAAPASHWTTPPSSGVSPDPSAPSAAARPAAGAAVAWPDAPAPPSARPASARSGAVQAGPDQARSEQSSSRGRSEQSTAGPGRPGPARSGSGRGATSGRRSVPVSPYDDIPPSLDEPPLEEELPPDDGGPVPSGWPAAAPVGRAPKAAASSPERSPASPPATGSSSNQSASNASAEAASGPARSSVPTSSTPARSTRPAAPVWPEPVTPPGGSRAAASTPASERPPTVDLTDRAPAGPSIDLADDLPSADDADFEGSPLVGTQVVEQLLGARVIEVTEK
jgi:DNA polymerase III subunit gamma/tau